MVMVPPAGRRVLVTNVFVAVTLLGVVAVEGTVELRDRVGAGLVATA